MIPGGHTTAQHDTPHITQCEGVLVYHLAMTGAHWKLYSDDEQSSVATREAKSLDPHNLSLGIAPLMS